MVRLCGDAVEKARKTCDRAETVILRRLANVTQTAMAELLGVNVSTVSRMVSDDRFSDICRLIDALGLKVVSAGARHVEDDFHLGVLLMLQDYIRIKISEHGKD